MDTKDFAAGRKISCPVLLLWGDADRFFKVQLARRLSAIFPDAHLIEIAGGRTFHPLDDPHRVAAEIERAFYAPSLTHED